MPDPRVLYAVTAVVVVGLVAWVVAVLSRPPNDRPPSRADNPPGPPAGAEADEGRSGTVKPS